MNKYVTDLHLFSKKLCAILINKKMTDKNGKPDPIKLYNMLCPDDPILEEDIKKFGRSNFTEKTRRERNWINGANYPKTMKDILSLCNVLDCDLDYFFTDMPAPTHDLEFISKETNLSHDSILYIQNATEYEQLILDAILKKEYFRDICYAIYSYMQTYYKELQMQDANIESVKLQDKEKMELAEYRATKHFANTLINKIANDEDIKKYNKYEHGREILRRIILSDNGKKDLEQKFNEVENFIKSGKGDFNDYIEYFEEDEPKKTI